MSQTSIGRAALVLTTNASGLRSGLDKAAHDVSQWEQQVGRTFGNVVRGHHAGGFKKTWGQWWNGIPEHDAKTGKLLGHIGGAKVPFMKFAGAAAIGTAALGAFGVKASETLQEVAKGGAAAQAFGITAERFTGIAGVAKSVGEDQREFIESLVTLGKVAAEGAAGTGMVAPQWFKDLNLNAKEFNALPIDEKFLQVWEALAKIEDPAKRVRALMVAFGEDGGKYLLPLLSKTPQEVRAMAKEFAVSTAEVEKATAANAELTKAQTAVGAAWRGIAVAFAPMIGRLAAGLARLRPLFDWISRAIGTLVDIGAAVFDAIGDAVREAAAEVKGWIGNTEALEAVWPSVRDVIVFTFRSIGIGAALAWDTIKSGAGVVAIVFGAILEYGGSTLSMFRRIVDLGRKLPESMRPAGFEKFADAVGAADDKVRGWGRDAKEWGKRAVTSWGESAVKFTEWLDRALTEKPKKAMAEMGKAAAAAGDAALKQLDNHALLKGSTAEVTARMKAEFKASLSKEDKLLLETKKGTGHLKSIDGGIKKIAGKVKDDLKPL